MLILDWNYLTKEGRQKPIEEIELSDFMVEVRMLHKADFIALLWKKDTVKILKNVNGLVGIFSLSQFKEILESKL